MSQVQPSLGIWYRVQNLDLGYHLEFPAAADGEYATGRILKDTVAQHWKFVPTDKNTYKIVNAAASEESADTYYALGVEASSNLATAEDEDSGKTVWTVSIPSSGAYCTITTVNPQKPRTKAYLQMDQVATMVDVDNKRNTQRWRLIEVVPFVDLPPPLPRDTYRIRNIDGISILTVHTDSLTLDPQETGKHQAWEILPLGNGNYEIKKANQGDYLSWQRSDNGIYKVTIDLKPFTWIIRSLGGFVYALSPKISGVDLGLTAASAKQTLLTRRETARNQVWFIEPSTFTEDYDPDPHGPDAPERIAAISEGKYVLQNVSTKHYASVGNGYLNPYSSDTTGMQPLVFHYDDPTTPYFNLHAFSASLYIIPSNNLVATGQYATPWYLVKDQHSTGY